MYFAQVYERPIWVMADKKRMRQVFINLIENAIKYGVEKRREDQDQFF